MNSDAELLGRYASEGSEPAFGELVTRHVDLVYSAAVRCLNGDAHRAEDVTQEVFAEMARKSGTLARHEALVGWLYVAARRMSLRAIRSEQRRLAREKEATQMTDIQAGGGEDRDWQHLSRELDSAMERLGSTDRLAVLLRFFQKKNFHDVGAALGLGENAARMRVDRALSKLRSELLRKGVRSTTTALAAALLANAVLAAPPVFVSGAAAKSLAKAAAFSGAGVGVGIMEWMALMKSQLAGVGAVVIAAAVVFVTVQNRLQQKPLTQVMAASQGTQAPGTGVAAKEKKPPSEPAASENSAVNSAAQGGTVQAEVPEKNPEVEKEVLAMIADWEGLPSIFDDAEIYTKQLRRLKEIGPAATPILCAALERTSRDTPMRLIPFAMRVIGDAHAIPALIRTIPRTLRPPGSDCALSVKDYELMRFMQSNHLAAVEGYAGQPRNFDMARPVREVAASLHKLTGTHLNEEGVFTTFLEGGEAQRAAQRRAYYDVAVNWANWWKNNAQRFVKDLAPADLELAIAKPADFKADSAERFLTGSNVKVTGGASGAVLSPVEQGKNCALQLALGRRINLPSSFLEKGADASVRKLVDWAAGAGVDLLGGQYSEGNSGKPYYSMQGVGLRAWEVSNASWDGIEKMIERGEFPKLGRAAGDWLMRYDAAQERYLPEKKATFVFITRDGLQGMLRVTAQVTEPMDPRRIGTPAIVPDESGEDQRTASGPDRGAQFDYKFFYVETEELKKEGIARENARERQEIERKERKMARLFEKYPKFSGTVLLPNGEAAVGAEVLLAVPGEGAVLGRKGFENRGYSTVVDTATNGGFVLPRVPKASRIYATHEQGFADVEIEGTQEPISIHLAPWGNIEGTVLRQGKPAPHQKFALMPRAGETETPLHLAFFQAESDEQGRFSFAKLPPGEIQICRLVNNTFYAGQMAKVVAGQTTSIKFGSTGRTVKGQFRTSDGSTVEWAKNPGFYFQPKKQENGKGSTPGLVTRMPVSVSADGELSIEDVPPGKYDFRGDIREGAGEWELGKTLGRFKRDVTVPQDTGELDIGEIIVEMLPVP